MTDFTTFANTAGSHAFEITTNNGRFMIHANNRTQAGAIARKAGHTIRDVNMVG